MAHRVVTFGINMSEFQSHLLTANFFKCDFFVQLCSSWQDLNCTLCGMLWSMCYGWGCCPHFWRWRQNWAL